MRIGFDGTPLLGPRTGIGWYTYDLIEALSVSDECVVWPISWRTARGVNAPAGARVVRRFAPARPLWELWNRAAFPPLETFVRCDVFHATNFLSPPAWRTPTVVTVHDLTFVRRPHEVAAGLHAYARLLPRTLRRADAVIAVSHFTKRELVEWLPWVEPKVHVVHEAAHPRALAQPKQPGFRYALMIGGFYPRKNLPLALEALRIVNARGAGLKLVVLGAPHPLFDASVLAGREDVIAPGYVPDGEVASWLAGAEMVLWPSTYEGFGLVLLEAMAAGIPVVASDTGCNPEVVGIAGILAAPEPEAFAAGIEAVDVHRDRLVALGRARAAEFSWTRVAQETRSVYRSITG